MSESWFAYWTWRINTGGYEHGVMLAECRLCGDPITDLAIREGVVVEDEGLCARCGIAVLADLPHV